MKVPIVVGVVIGIVVLAAGLLAPGFRSASSKSAEKAREQAALAERLLHRYDHQVPELNRAADPAAVKTASLEPILERTREKLRAVNQEFTGVINRMKSRAERDGLSPGSVQALTPDASGLRAALDRFQAVVKANSDLLKQAADTAKQARSGEGAGVLGVPDISGMVEYTRADELLAESQVLRQEQQTLQAHLLRVGAQWSSYRANQDYLAGIDVRDILRALRTDLEDVQQRAAEGAKQVETLAADVAQREKELAGVTSELQEARNARLALEQQGFQAGDDGAFDAYRTKYTALTDRLLELEAKEQLLRLGGLRNAKFESDDVLSGPVQGEEVASIDELKRRLEVGQERSRRLAAGVETLQKQLGFVESSGQSAKQDQEHYSKLVSELDVAQKEIVPPLLELAKKASDKESEALKAAREAVAACDAAQQAADKWLGAARELQSAKDPERNNPRLKMITGDATVANLGNGEKAAALLLVGRIYAQRIESDESLLADMKIFGEMRPETEFKSDAFAEEIRVSREEAIKRVTDAVNIYKKLSSGSQATKWVPQAGLAAAYHLLARVNPAESATLLASALQAAEEAVKGKEQSPFVADHVLFRDHLRARIGQPTSQPEGETPTTSPETPAGGD